MNQAKKTSAKKRNNKGFALIWAMLISLLMMTMAVTMTVLAIKEIRATSNTDESQRAINAAEAGMERAMSIISDALSSQVDACINQSGISDTLSSATEEKLSYTVNIKTDNCDSDSRRITVISEGASSDSTKRKIRTVLRPVVAGASADVFNYSTGLGTLSSGYFDPQSRNPQYEIPKTRTVTQNFDVTGLAEDTNSQAFTLGMIGNSQTNFGISINGGASITMTLSGKIGGQNFNKSISISKNTLDSKTIDSEGYSRLKLEIATEGSNYSTVRATLLKRSLDSGKANYVCPRNGIGNTPETTITVGINGTPGNLTLVKTANLEFYTDGDGDKYLRLPGSDAIKVRSMSLIGKE